MYYTVWNSLRRGYHQEDPDVDTITVSERGATQFATWLQAFGRAGELMTITGEHHIVVVQDWPDGVEVLVPRMTGGT